MLADPAFADVPVERLISKQYAAERGRLIDARSASKRDMVPSFGSLSGDTVYVAAVDRDGNAASLIQSLYGAFGSCVVAGNTGVILQNRGAYSRSIATTQSPRARQDPAAYADCLDGQTRRQALERARLHGRGWPAANPVQLYSAMIDFGVDIEVAIETPRFLSGRSRSARRETAAYPGPSSRSYDRCARATRPHHQSIGRLERNGRSCRWHHDRTAERHVERGFRPAQRWGGDRLLGHHQRSDRSRTAIKRNARQASISFKIAFHACGDKVRLSARSVRPNRVSRKTLAGLEETLRGIRPFVSNWCGGWPGRR